VLDALLDRQAKLRLADFGTGSGCLLLALLTELPAASGIGVDIDAAAAEVARGNAARLGLERRTQIVQGEWGRSLSGPFDIIVSNPPYIPTGDLAGLEPELRYEPRLALDGGDDGLAAYRRLIPDAARLLQRGGLLALEIGMGQAPAVEGLLVASGLIPLGVRRDLALIERCVLARR
jgi:release factor glutamine methyltransferase